MAEIPLALLVHRIAVKPYAGVTGGGPTYGAEVASIPCFRDDKTRLVRDGSGAEVTSSTTLFLRLGQADRFPEKSLVDLGHRAATVVAVARRDDAGAFGAWQHLEVALS